MRREGWGACDAKNMLCGMWVNKTQRATPDVGLTGGGLLPGWTLERRTELAERHRRDGDG